jgi:ABC-type nitrate/sulfonate/bicarbonate transport system permease component
MGIRRTNEIGRRAAVSMIVPIGLLVAWELASGTLIDAFILPPPTAVARGLLELIADGSLQSNIAASLFRIFSGWLIGSLVAIPFGLLVSASTTARMAIDPMVHFLRFVPAIALITLFILWLGIGEESKIALIVYAVAFIVLVNTASGVAAIPADKLDAARTLGANRVQLFFLVITPATVPYMFVGMRIALASAFVVIVGAEIIAANSGLGYLVWTSRLYFRIDWIFGGVITIGLLGFITDRAFMLIGRRFLGRYLGRVAQY